MAINEKYTVTIKLNTRDRGQIQAMVKQLNILMKQAEKTGDAVDNSLGKAANKTSKAVRGMNGNIQNLSFQMQDVIVQVTNGTSVVRSLGQQLPQMLIGFGKWGAIIGVVAAALPVMAYAVASNVKEMKKLSDQLDTLNENIEKMAAAVSSVNFDAWRNAFNEMDEQARRLAVSILELRLQAEQLQFDAAIKSFTGFTDVIVEGSRLADIQLQSIADSIGISVGSLEQLIPLARQFRDDPFADPENLSKMVELLEKGGVDALPFIKSLERLKQAQESLTDARRASAQALEAGPAGNIQVGDISKQVEDAQKSLEYIDVNARKADYEFPLTNAQKAFIETMEESNEALNDFSNNYVKEFDVLATTTDVFASTFETAFNGVAMGTQSVSDAFENMVKSIIAQLAKLYALKGIELLFPSLSGQLVKPYAKGGVFQNGDVTPFAKGGVVHGPTVFPMAKGGVGLMGEAGSPEAIMPLTRTASGNLGVEATGMNVTVNNMVPNAQVKTTRDENGLSIDVIMDTIASAVQRGGNNVADALEQTYPLNRGRQVY